MTSPSSASGTATARARPPAPNPPVSRRSVPGVPALARRPGNRPSRRAPDRGAPDGSGCGPSPAARGGLPAGPEDQAGPAGAARRAGTESGRPARGRRRVGASQQPAACRREAAQRRALGRAAGRAARSDRAAGALRSGPARRRRGRSWRAFGRQVPARGLRPGCRRRTTGGRKPRSRTASSMAKALSSASRCNCSARIRGRALSSLVAVRGGDQRHQRHRDEAGPAADGPGADPQQLGKAERLWPRDVVAVARGGGPLHGVQRQHRPRRPRGPAAAGACRLRARAARAPAAGVRAGGRGSGHRVLRRSWSGAGWST